MVLNSRDIVYKAINNLGVRDFGLSFIPANQEEFEEAFYSASVEGKEFPVITWQDIKDEIQMIKIRNERNKRLAETDYLALSDQTLSPEMEAYRQALRDITDDYTHTSSVVWPEKPE